MLLYGVPDREAAWRTLGEPWDLIVVGGGITGAGILREAVRVGLRVLLLEQNDFASGTSSRSSKLVHGGLRYLANFQLKIVYQSVVERNELLREGPGLIEPLPFVFPTYPHDKIPAWGMRIALSVYSWLVGKWQDYQALRPADVQMLLPGLTGQQLKGGFRYLEAQTDDTRLVLRVLREGVATGRAVALNYAHVETLLRGQDGLIDGVHVQDCETGAVGEARARAVVNATGAWADKLRGEMGAEGRIRPLRGSHLTFHHYRFPLYHAVSFPHPDDGRPVFAFPWEGVTLVGTTDLDHEGDLDGEAAISREEFDYLLRGAQAHFPEFDLRAQNVIATYAGVRPVISSSRDTAPSKESREHVFWNENGLLTVTGGKLTTFRHIALEALQILQHRLPRMKRVDNHMAALDPIPPIGQAPHGLSRGEAQRLVARYGIGILDFARECPPAELRCVDGLPIHWLELRWAARYEAVRHLGDLLLRRVRLGLLAPGGGEKFLPQIRSLVQDELGWDDSRWEQEQAAYLAQWQAHYSAPHD